MVTFGMVGLGQMGVVNVQGVSACSESRIAAVMDQDYVTLQKNAKKTQAKACESYDEILQDKNIDAVFLSVPHDLHKDFCIRALEAGKHIIVEKPIASNLEDARKIIEVLKKTDKTVAINYCFRFLPPVEYAKLIIDQGCIGQLIGCEIMMHQEKEMAYWIGAKTGNPNDWRCRRSISGGGMLIMTACHELDYMSSIIPEKINSVSCEYAVKKAPGDCEDILTMNYRFDNGAIGLLSTSSVMKGVRQSEVRVWGDRGTIILGRDNVKFYSTSVIDKKRPGRWHHKKFVKGCGALDCVTALVTDFCSAVQNGTACRSNVDTAMYNLSIIEAAYHAHETRSYQGIAG